MKTAKVVIGANYGDEGKGLVTDYLAHQMGEDGVVVRFNGGSQAGHTVITPQGVGHVFGHFGSGTFAGYRTHLSRFFIVNPFTFIRERVELEKKGYNPKVTVSPDTMVTTVYDMIINQAYERKLGRNASCGLGINETIERDLFGVSLRMKDIVEGNYEDILSEILQKWVPLRIAYLGVANVLTSADEKILRDDAATFISHQATNMHEMLSKVLIIEDDYLRSIKNIIFEGAQGLMLDQRHQNFPFVTRSNTGRKNVINMMDVAGVTKLDFYYVSRGYLTRHGDGPFPDELDLTQYPDIKDKTNVPNKYQGTLRFAELDLEDLVDNVAEDEKSTIPIESSKHLVITCMDQLPGEKRVDIIEKTRTLDFETLHLSYGPTCDNVLFQRKRNVTA